MPVQILIRCLVMFAVLVPATISIADEPAADSSENLALQKPYRLSAVPSTQYYHLLIDQGKPVPDMNTALTDGIVSKSQYFWVSPLCLNFNASVVDVVIDLEAVYPIEEIFTHHGSNPKAGVTQPTREAYFTSLDGVQFVKVGQDGNDFDPETITARNKEQFFAGLKTFRSGKLKTKGRYVLVRTWSLPDNPENPGLVMGMSGHDEILVKRGDFSTEEIKLDLEKAITTQLDLDDSLTGYPFRTRDWQSFLTQTPLAYLMIPHSFRGAKTYHMSVGGVFAIEFFPQNNSLENPNNITFRCSFPDSVEILDWNKFLKIESRQSENINGIPHTTITQTIPSPSFLRHPLFVVAPGSKTPTKNLGSIVFRWQYDQDGKTYSSDPQEYRIVLEKEIRSPTPQRFKVGVWSPQSNKCLHHDYETTKRLFQFYQQLGFNWINGGHSNAGIFRAATEGKMDNCFEKSVLPNAFAPALFNSQLKSKWQQEIPFVFSDSSKKLYGVCPTQFLSGRYDRDFTDHIKTKLKTTRDIYDNWEPYQFKKHGCVCEDCKESFAKFTKTPLSQVDQIWPEVVTDWEHDGHNAFFSSQIGSMVAKTQHCLDAASQELKLDYRPRFIPSISPRYFNPSNDWYRVHHPKEFLKSTRALITWSYTNSINPFTYFEDDLIGNNLKFVPQIQNVLEARRKYGHSDPQGNRLPKLYSLQTQYYFGTNLVLPKDHYFGAVLAFVMGYDGIGTWQETHQQEARYLRQQARANRFISRYEKIVLDGKVIPDTSMEQADGERSDSDRPPLFCRGFQYQGKVYLAVGNDHLDELPAVISWPDPQDASRRKEMTITIPGKSWGMLKPQSQ